MAKDHTRCVRPRCRDWTEGGDRFCPYHREMARTHNARWRAGQYASARENDHCRLCKTPRFRGTRLCERHLLAQRGYNRKYRKGTT